MLVSSAYIFGLELWKWSSLGFSLSSFRSVSVFSRTCEEQIELRKEREHRYSCKLEICLTTESSIGLV